MASYDGLNSDAIAELSEITEKQGLRALRAVNSRASERLAAVSGSAQPAKPAKHMIFGIYFYHEPHTAADSTQFSGQQKQTK
ncbi:MAG: hypothetical protein ACXW11_07015 [Methylotenera sp.]